MAQKLIIILLIIVTLVAVYWVGVYFFEDRNADNSSQPELEGAIEIENEPRRINGEIERR